MQANNLFKQYCSACHSLEQDQKLVGTQPLPRAESLRIPSRHQPAYAPWSPMAKGTMPSFKNQLAPPEVEEIIVYLRSIE